MPPHDKYLFCDPKQPLDKRIADLVHKHKHISS